MSPGGSWTVAMELIVMETWGARELPGWICKGLSQTDLVLPRSGRSQVQAGSGRQGTLGLPPAVDIG